MTLILIAATAAIAYGQQQVRRLEFIYEQDVSILDQNRADNAKAFKELSDLFDEIKRDPQKTIVSITMDSYCSPEGGVSYNDKLSQRRADHIYSYVHDVHQMPDSIMTSRANGINWDELAVMVGKSDMKYKDEIIDIIENVEAETWKRVKPTDRWLTLVDSRHKHLMDLKGGKPYWDMYNNIFPQLRSSCVVNIYYVNTPMVGKAEMIAPTSPAALGLPSIYQPYDGPDYKPLFAIKTNLLYDVLTVLNVEVEIPIKERWSVAWEHTFPWWIWDNGEEDSSRHRLELLSENIELKYWFGDRTDKMQLTGWYMGVYGHSGKYDFEYSREGYQGEYWGIGLTGGYAHTINKKGNLRLEYSVSAGYVDTDYRDYEAFFGADDLWHPIRLSSNQAGILGPTRARISLEWMLFRKVKKGGRL